MKPRGVAHGLGVAIALLLGTGQPAAAEPASPDTHALLNVPFLPQGRLLCGGASVAMVQRYWGEPDVHAEDFDHLVDAPLGGISTTDLLEAVRSHGWDAFAFRSDRETIRYHLSHGRPLVALLRSSGNAFHYVVVTGSVGEYLVVHDPSIGPFRLRSFDQTWKDWEATDFWTLLILPSSRRANREGEENDPTPETVTFRPVAKACESLVQEALGLTDDLSTATELLSAAEELCPDEAIVFRELAAVHFRKGEWSEAASFAEGAVELDPNDEHTWSLLGASRYLDGDHDGALAAWNETGTPTLDTVSLTGLTETRQEVIYRYLALKPGSLVTVEQLRKARRRIADLPTIGRSRVSFEPVSTGRATLVASVTERERFEPLTFAILRSSVDALTDRVTRTVVSSPTGGGERLEAGLRWWDTRPAFWLSLEGPGLMKLPGIVTLEAQVERQRYALGSSDGLSDETRRAARLTIADWLSSSTKAELGVGVDLFPSQGEWIQLRGGIERRITNDHLSLRADASRWFSVGAAPSFTELGATLAARITSRHETWALTARFDARSVTEAAPLAIWPGAGLGRARPLLLRAYPLLEDGVLSGEGFGPRLLHGTIEAERVAWSAGPARVGIATFLDWASVWSDPAEPVRALSSAGLGLRLHVLGSTLRLDGATKLRAGGMVLSAGWVESW